MSDSLITFFGIYFLSLFKFIAGPMLGSAAGYSLFESIFVTVAGMMTSVVLFTLIGSRFKKFLKLRFTKNKPIFSKKNRNLVKIWKKYGEIGIAIITPLILTPIGGTLIMVSFGAKKRHIYLNMLLSSLFWATVFCLSIDRLMHIPLLKNLLG